MAATVPAISKKSAVLFTQQEDHDLLDQVATYNPFKRGNSWPGLKAAIGEDHPLLSKRTHKSLSDRTATLIAKRARQRAQEDAA